MIVELLSEQLSLSPGNAVLYALLFLLAGSVALWLSRVGQTKKSPPHQTETIEKKSRKLRISLMDVGTLLWFVLTGALYLPYGKTRPASTSDASVILLKRMWWLLPAAAVSGFLLSGAHYFYEAGQSFVWLLLQLLAQALFTAHISAAAFSLLPFPGFCLGDVVEHSLPPAKKLIFAKGTRVSFFIFTAGTLILARSGVFSILLSNFISMVS